MKPWSGVNVSGGPVDKSHLLGNYGIALLVILVAVGLTYWKSVSGEFVVDDKVWAALPNTHGPFGKLTSIFTSWGFAETSLQVKGPPIYRPLGTLILMLFHGTFGPNPVAYHLFSLVSHYGNCVLVFVLLGLLLPSLSFISRLVCVLAFALHPALTEAVVWISSVGELQMTTCVLSGMICYLHWKRIGRGGWLVAAAFSALAGVMIKESALAFVLLVMAYDWCLERKVYWHAVALISVGTALYFAGRLLAIGSMAGGKRLSYSVWKLTLYGAAHLRYLFIPGQQPFSLAPPDGPVAGAAALVMTGILVLLLVWWGWRQSTQTKGILCLGGAWIVITLWPAYAIALVGAGFFAGRHIYLPAVGWTLLLGTVVATVSRTLPSLQYVLIAGVVLMAVLSSQGGGSWHTDVAVYQRSAELSPNDRGALEGLADALFAAGSTDRALAAYGKLLDRVADPRARRGYLYRLALIQGERGMIAESNKYLLDILQESPDYAAAWVGLGNNAWISGQLDSALQNYQRALQLEPGNLEAARNHAELLKKKGGPGL